VLPSHGDQQRARRRRGPEDEGRGREQESKSGGDESEPLLIFLWSCGLGYFDTNALFFMSYFHSVYICEPVMAGGLGLMNK
jgi:hypothetical protein